MYLYPCPLKHVCFLIVLMLITHVGSTAASACKDFDDPDFYKTYSVIVKAKAVNSTPAEKPSWFSFAAPKTYRTQFTILRPFTVVTSKTLILKHDAKGAHGITFEPGQDYFIFARSAETGDVILDSCSPTLRYRQQPIPEEESIQFLAGFSEYKKHLDALAFFETRLQDRYDTDRARVLQMAKDIQNQQRPEQDLNPFRVQDTCFSLENEVRSAHAFMQRFPAPAPEGLYMNDRRDLIGYGHALFKLKRYYEAWQAFCLGREESPKEADFYMFLATLRLGKEPEQSLEFIDASGLRLEGLNLSFLSHGPFRFTDASASGLDMEGADFSHSNFKMARFKNIAAPHALFKSIQANGAELIGSFLDADFTNADLKNVKFGNSDLRGADFTDANLKGADFSLIPLPQLTGIILKDAIYDQSTLWPTGFLPKKAGAVLVNGKLPDYNIPVFLGARSGNPDLPGDYRVNKPGIYLYDGRHIRDIRKIYLENGHLNIIKINSLSLPGLTRKTDDKPQSPYLQARIQGDIYRDIVVLDNCFDWEIQPEDSLLTTGFYKPTKASRSIPVQLQPYFSAPESGYQVKLLIQTGLRVSFSNECMKHEVYNSNTTIHQETVPYWDFEHSDKMASKLADYRQKVLALEKQWARKAPPRFIELPKFAYGAPDCPAGQRIYTKSGRYTVDIPEGCPHVYVKAWGGGGGNGGGSGGFTTGLVRLPKDAKIEVIVGGAGGDARNATPGKGGFNGGGDGGLGTDLFGQFMGGGGGGGRTELLINDEPVVIAGGGGGGSRKIGGHGGGGRSSDDIVLYNKETEHAALTSVNGSQGRGGQPIETPGAFPECQPAEPGGKKTGGQGGGRLTDECRVNGGGGGGGGYGGGSGGSMVMPGYGGGGGGGLAPEHGLTIWAKGHLPPNSNDNDRAAFAGRIGHDGMIVVVWPAPDPEEFYNSVLGLNARRVEETKSLKKYYQNMAKQQARFNKGAHEDHLRSLAPVPYSIDKAQNLSVYDRWRSETHPREADRYAVVHNLMDRNKLPTEFVMSGDLYDLKPKDYILRQLFPNYLRPLNSHENIMQFTVGQNQQGRLFSKGWGQYNASVTCSEARPSRFVFAPKVPDAFGGVGMALRAARGLIEITQISINGPAMLSGLNPGDVITHINNKSVKKLGLLRSMARIRGALDTEVLLTVRKAGFEGPEKTYTIKRAYFYRQQPRTAKALMKTSMSVGGQIPVFYIFDQGISPSQVVWESPNTLVYRETGDLITINDTSCIKFVFTEDGDFQSPESQQKADPYSQTVFEGDAAETPGASHAIAKTDQTKSPVQGHDTMAMAMTLQSIKDIMAAVQQFKSDYGALPGDLSDAATHIEQCKTQFCASGNGNGVLEDKSMKQDLRQNELYLFWLHLIQSGLLKTHDAHAAEHMQIKSLQHAALGGYFAVKTIAQPGTGTADLPLDPGLYLLYSHARSGELSSEKDYHLTGEQASQLDQILDDGLPHMGMVRAVTTPYCPSSGLTGYMDSESKCIALLIRLDP